MRKTPAAQNLISDARSLSDVALRMVWRSRLPLVIVFCGVSASGKSTLADALSRVSGYAHLSSDLIRKELAGVAPDERGSSEIYDDSMSIRTYDELARRACAEIESGHGALVDATFAHRQYRRKLLESLGPTGARVLFCECRAPAAVLERRAQARERSPERGSDATRQVLREQLTQFEPLDEIPARDHLPLRTDRPLDEALEDLELFASNERRPSTEVGPLPRDGMSTAAIDTTKLTKYYGRSRGIEDLSLEVERGEVFGFLGPNGAGKTTTIRLLLDLIRPSRGQALILGLDTRQESLEVRRRTSYLPGELKLPERRTGRQFLSFLSRIRGKRDRTRSSSSPIGSASTSTATSVTCPRATSRRSGSSPHSCTIPSC